MPGRTDSTDRPYDIAIAGGGPAGLSAALVLGRARKRILLCDAGTRRNAAAEEIHGFVTRDGTPPAEFRRVARAELAPYRSVEVRDVLVERITGESGDFQVHLASGVARARRILLCTGMIDELPELPGVRELWGRSIFQCPYCHGWEAQDRAFGFLAPSVERVEFGLLLRGWARDVMVFTDGRFEVPPELKSRLARAGVSIEERRLAGFVSRDGHLDAIVLADGERVSRDVLFAAPAQRQVAFVQELGLAVDEAGFVQVDQASGETSRPGIYAAGDLTTPRQAAIMAAAAGMLAAVMVNHALTAELATAGALP